MAGSSDRREAARRAVPELVAEVASVGLLVLVLAGVRWLLQLAGLSTWWLVGGLVVLLGYLSFRLKLQEVRAERASIEELESGQAADEEGTP